MAEPGGKLESAFLERAFPHADREQFDRQWVEFHVDEINCLGDRIRFFQAQNAPDAQDGIQRARARIAEILQVLRWNRELALRLTWETARRRPDFPEDVFGPAVILSALDDAERVHAWLDTLDEHQRAILVQTGVDGYD